MILVGPRVKAALCEWAQANKMFDDPENVEIMRKVRPTEGHDDHFHLRIHCSPYYPECVDGGAKNTLCD
jgi:murein endopeptidase